MVWTKSRRLLNSDSDNRNCIPLVQVENIFIHVIEVKDKLYISFTLLIIILLLLVDISAHELLAPSL